MTDLPRTADVVVIGAGIVGCAAAYHLAAAGAGRVLLLDREDAVGMGSTGACAGGFRQQFSTEVNIRLSRASVPMIVGFTEEHGIPLDVTQDGYLFLVREAASWRSFLRGVELQRSLGVEVETLSPDDAAALVPGVNVEGVIGATFGPRDGIADPCRAHAGLREPRPGRGASPWRSASRSRRSWPTVREPASGPEAARWPRAPWSSPPVRGRGRSRPPSASTSRSSPCRGVVVTTGPFPGVPERRTLVIDADSSFYVHREADGVLMGMGGADEPTFDTSVDDRFVERELLPKAARDLPAARRGGHPLDVGGPVRDDAGPASGDRPRAGRRALDRSGFQRARLPAGADRRQAPGRDDRRRRRDARSTSRRSAWIASRVGNWCWSTTWCEVPGAGVEPARAEAHGILSPARLPVPPSRPAGDSVHRGWMGTGRSLRCPPRRPGL